MKALIFGNRGWIGNMMSKLLNNSNIEFVSASSRANNKHDVEAEILREKPTHVMSFIGRTHGTHEGKEFTTIDFLEQKGRIVDNVRDNLFSPMVLAMLCKKHNIHFTYLGTGCIFKYDDDHPMGNESIGFTEESLPNFFGSGYSVVKGYTDELMHLFEDNVLNLRIRMPITDKLEPRNFITKITTYEYICSIPNAMTVLDELLPYALDMARKGITGTINLTNPGLVSHNEILEMYREIVDPSFTWKNFSQEEQAKILAADRSNNCLDTSKLKEIFPEVKHIKDSVRETLERMKNRL
jgi:3,5-epimerase/4-reductase